MKKIAYKLVPLAFLTMVSFNVMAQDGRPNGSVPSPAVLALIAAGGLGMFLSKRKK